MAATPGHLRPRSYFELLDGSIRHYRARFLPFILVFVPTALTELFVGIYTSVFQTAAMEERIFGAFDFLGLGTVLVLSTGLQIIFSMLGYGATVFLAAADLRGASLGPRAAWSLASGRFWAIIGLTIVLVWIVGVGMLFLVVPGIYLAVRFGVSVQALLLEKCNVGDALGRSGELIRGHFWRGLGIMVFIVVLITSLSFLPAAFSLGVVFFVDEEGEIDSSMGYYLVLAIGQVVGAVTSLLTAPLSSLIATHFYFDLRVRREGLDLATRLQRLEASPA